MTNRRDFSLKYLIALYLHHREYRDITPTINNLKNEYSLPNDDYLELELFQYFESRGWVDYIKSGVSELDWPLTIRMSGKEASESEIESGFTTEQLRRSISPFQAFALDLNNDIRTIVPDTPEVVSAKNAVDELHAKLSSANDVGKLSIEERNAALVEIDAIRKILDGSSLRLKNTVDSARNTFRWVAEKASGTIIESLAQSAFLAIIAIFGLSL